MSGSTITKGYINAPEGYLFFCPCCGKYADNRYGEGKRTYRGWDASCVMNSILIEEERALEAAKAFGRIPDGERRTD